MEKSLRLRNNLDFQSVFNKGKSFWNRQLTVIVKKNKSLSTRVGFTVSKKYGNAVERNKIKRRLREIIRKNQDLLLKNYDYVLIPKKNTIDMDYNSLDSSVKHVLTLVKRKIR